MNIKVRLFAQQMEVELLNNADKGDVLDWKGLPEKFMDLNYHEGKLLIAIKEKNSFAIKEYIADCANILLSIGNEFHLYDDMVINEGKESILINQAIEIHDVGVYKRRKLQ